MPHFIDKIVKWLWAFWAERWVRFLFVGGSSTLIYAIVGITGAWFGWPILLANTLAYVLSFIFSYLAQRRYTFRSQLPHSQLLPKYAALQIVGLGLNTGIIFALMHMGLPYIIAMGIAIVAVPVFTYIVNKIWVFRAKKAPESL